MKCIICSKNQWTAHWKKLVSCKNCGFIRAADRYFKADTKSFYTKNYFNGIDYYNYESEKSALQKNFSDRLKRISKFKKRGELLELGCAYGYFLKAAQSKFNCTGIDIDKNVTQIAKLNAPNARILTGDLSKLKIRKSSFDVVCMFDTIEHLKNPEKIIAQLNLLLKENGLIIIETGDIGALLPSIQKERWRLVTPPIHLQYFSKKTLTKLLAKHGFKVLTFDYVSFYRTLGQTVYRTNKNSFLLKIFKSLMKIEFPLQTFDLQFVIARKSNLSRVKS